MLVPTKAAGVSSNVITRLGVDNGSGILSRTFNEKVAVVLEKQSIIESSAFVKSLIADG